jgi:hypothetical protein
VTIHAGPNAFRLRFGAQHRFPRTRPTRSLLVPFAIVVLLTVSLWASTPSPAGRPGPSPVSSVRTQAGNPLAAATASLTAGRGPNPGIRWDCSPSLSGAVRCSAPEPAAPSPASSGSGWFPVTTSGGLTAGVGFLVYDAQDSYDLLMAEGPSTNATAFEGTAAVYSIFEDGIWSSLSLSGGPLYCAFESLAYDSSDHEVVYWGGSTCTSAGDTWTYQGGVWQNVSTTPSPPALRGSSLSNDPSVLGLLWFGGCCSAGYNVGTNWTWKFVAGSWTNLSTGVTSLPTGEWDGSMAYDATDQGVLLVSGSTHASWTTTYTSWFFNGTWHPEPNAPVPNTGADSVAPALADDPSDGYVVLVPSWNGTNDSGISFHYSGGAWSAGRNHTGLVETLRPAMVFDGHRNADILLDGAGSSYPYQSPPVSTWAYAASTWTNLSAASVGPANRADMAVAYDAADGYVVGFGGCECPANAGYGGVQSDTWKFSAGNWTALATNASPPARALAGLAYDASDGYLLMFGGQGASSTFNDTWEFTNGGWTQITPLVAPPWSYGETMTYDAADNCIVLLTGTFPAATWTYHAGTWTNLTALGDRTIDGAPANPVVYDSTDGYVLLFGTAHLQSASTPYLEPDTWKFQGGNWTNITSLVGTSPPDRTMASVGDFPAGGFVLLYGGSTTWGTVSTPRNDTWSYTNDTWTELAPMVSPGNRTDMPGAYDPTLSADVFFGGWYGTSGSAPLACSLDGPCGDTWDWAGGSLTSPVIQSFSASPATIDLGASTRLSVSVTGGTPPLTFVYTGLPSGCASANASALTCTPNGTGTSTVTVVVTDSAGDGTSAQTVVNVAPVLQITAFFATPAPTEVAERTLLSVQTSDGTPPLSYAYSGLPTGCVGQDVPTLPCTPTGTGNFTVGVAVHDAGGKNASASLTLTVGAAGSSGSVHIDGFQVAPATIVLGNSSTVSVNATSSGGPLTYAYGGLPPGCASANASSISCVPTSAGTYGVTISVRDPLGAVASVTGNLTVDPVGGGAGLSIVGFGASPGQASVGTTVVLSVVAIGGTGPLTYRYPSLPAGCVSANTSALPCAPTTPGTYPLYVVVTDSDAHSRGAVGTLDVVEASGPGPSVSAFFASPTNLTLGNSTTLVAEARGALPLSFGYAGLPPGCASADSGVLNCTPTDTGRFVVTITVRDAEGRSATANTSFVVVPPRTGPVQPANPVSSAGSGAGPVLLEAVLGVAFGALVSYAGVEFLLTRRRTRQDGEAIVRELSRPPTDDPVGPSER